MPLESGLASDWGSCAAVLQQREGNPGNNSHTALRPGRRMFPATDEARFPEPYLRSILLPVLRHPGPTSGRKESSVHQPKLRTCRIRPVHIHAWCRGDSNLRARLLTTSCEGRMRPRCFLHSRETRYELYSCERQASSKSSLRFRDILLLHAVQNHVVDQAGLAKVNRQRDQDWTVVQFIQPFHCFSVCNSNIVESRARFAFNHRAHNVRDFPGASLTISVGGLRFLQSSMNNSRGSLLILT